MAKRKRLTAPDADTLKEMESGFAAKPALETKNMAPISQIAGETASAAADLVQQDRETAAVLSKAVSDGLLAITIPLDQIDRNFVARDRMEQDAEAMEELKASIRKSGQRTPIEVVKTDEGYGLISGWRRLSALQELAVETGQGAFDTVKAFVREPLEAAASYLNMVEENEVRENLSHYERGRIAVVAAGQGAFASVEDAVDHLFSAASKAKRSKVRSFAMIHETLGDLLTFPMELTERTGLKLAKLLRENGSERFRAALDGLVPSSPAEELRALEAAFEAPSGDKKSRAGGRPKTIQPLEDVETKSGLVVKAAKLERGFQIFMQGRVVPKHKLERIQRQVARMLDQ